MNKKYYVIQDAALVDPTLKEKFFINPKDIYESIEGERYQFVGFIFSNDNVLVSFPKRTFSAEKRRQLERNVNVLKSHLRILFQCIIKASMKKGDKYSGIRNELTADFPFIDFFEIYQYYISYGLYTREREIKKFGYNGVISWKDTMIRSPRLIVDNNLLFVPLIIRDNIREHVFISKCMAYAIDSTLDLFSFFLEGEKTGIDTNDIDFQNRNSVIARLRRAKQFIFKDIHKKLINSIISFFESFNPKGGNYHLKIHSFHLIWEDMVGHYLKRFFIKINDKDVMEFTDELRRNDFKKEVFYPEVKGKDGYALEPDFYLHLKEENVRYIFDAKYYHELHELDYKQIAYYFLLKHFGLEKCETCETENKLKTYNALILPTEDENKSIIHFDLNPSYNFDEDRFYVIAQYLNTVRVMEYYLK